MVLCFRPSLPATVFCLTALLTSCGGGATGSAASSSVGGSSGNTAGAGTSSWTQGQYQPSASFAAQCLAPRSGTDPVTHQTYPDRQGTALDEKNWLRSWTDELYLWYQEVEDQDPAGFPSDSAYFAVLKTTAFTASGKPKDRFHFTYPTSTWESLSRADQTIGYGADFVLITNTPPRNVVVAYTNPSGPAASPPASLLRGTKLLTIDGVDVVNANDQASIDTLNSGLDPKSVGESHAFSVLDPGATNARAVTLVSADITSTPVLIVHTIMTAAGDLVGYMLFNDHLATAEGELVAAFNQLQGAGIHDLILDMRYNGGGLLDVASELAYMIAGPGPTTGQTFELSRFNAKNPTTNPITGKPITPLGFHSTTQGLSVAAGQPLPTLDLTRVFVLTGADTCSASESVINSLRGVGVQVVQIGSTTCGKPYAFYPADNCGTTYFSIELQGVNAQGFGDYPDGFAPVNSVLPASVALPGCSAADDFSHALGDTDEGLLSAALGYRANGACPAVPSAVAPASAQAGASYAPPAANGKSIRPFWRENRIQPPTAR